MATYAIGDIQGCFDEFESLLNKINFQTKSDTLWLTGDLVNRGPDSLKVLRFVKNMGDCVVSVLGNHDLHLLALAQKNSQRKVDPTLIQVLEAPDRDELLDWLRHRPLIHTDSTLGYTLLHAGLPPQWDITTAHQYANEVETLLRSSQSDNFFKTMYGDKPDQWSPQLVNSDRTRFITNSFTRLRYLDDQGRFRLDLKGPLGSQPDGCVPWFQMKNRQSRDNKIIFGHWSTLGFYDADGVIGLDTGCLWGGPLTAVQLDGPGDAPLVLNSVQCKRACDPKHF